MLEQIVGTPADGLVVDAFRQTPDAWFSKGEVAAFKRNHAAVLAYVSIGEAEDYRYYWNASWCGRLRGPRQPDWEGNVRLSIGTPRQAIVLNYVRNVAVQD